MNLDHLGVMLDCSRNGVLKVASVKRYIDIMQDLGFNTLMLYTEDTYEVDNQPYFGYLRGRYTQAELKEIDAYALAHGIELIPCIQTLAHLNAIVRWKCYSAHTDVNDILLCEDDRTYQLIEDMFTTLEKCFTSRQVNIGMDEAHMVGLGKYLDQHGFQNRFDILLTHLQKVCEIAQKHGFQIQMWSDMFFRLASGGEYYANSTFDASVTKAVPESVALVYWDYYTDNAQRYRDMIRAHQQFDNEIWFAGGLWTWRGFSPKNAMSIRNTDAAMTAVEDCGLKNVIFTVWGDNGAECSPFAILPSLYYAAQRAKGCNDMAAIKAGFQEKYGMAFDDFMLLDLPDTTNCTPASHYNPERYMLYNDCFCGIFDCVVPEGYTPNYTACAEKLEKLADHPAFGYLFASEAKLCRLLQVKYTIGVRTRSAYRAGDREALKAIVEDFKTMDVLVEDFYRAHQARWFRDNKPFGFDTQDLRIGGMKQRFTYCRERLEAYLRRDIDIIEELEEDILPEFESVNTRHAIWTTNATVNII